MTNLDNTFGQGNMDPNNGFSESEDEQERHIPHTITTRPVNSRMAHQVAEIFQQNVREPKNNMTTLQVRRTIRDRIFPLMKFTSEAILRQVKIKEEHNILHKLLQDLNRLDDDDMTRAKFWLTYKSEVKNVLTTRKTEVSNQMKEMVVECKCILMS